MVRDVSTSLDMTKVYPQRRATLLLLATLLFVIPREAEAATQTTQSARPGFPSLTISDAKGL
jgi:hypothetical protein